MKKRKPTMEKLKVGDPVEVSDPGLAMLRNMMAKFGNGVVKPNHHGWVKEIRKGEILVEFPIGDDDPDQHSQVAPYPIEMVKKRKGKPR